MDDTREIMSDEEAAEFYWKHLSSPGALHALLCEFAKRAREKWGVSGRRVDTTMSKDGLWLAGIYGVEDLKTRQNLRPATLYIHEPEPPKMTAEERIEKVIAEHERMHRQEANSRCDPDRRMACWPMAILRGEGGR